MLSLPVGTEMFHFPTFPLPALCVQAGVTGLASSRVSPFGNPRITVWLSTPRGLSQIPTSFFGSWYQGIHRVPLETWLQILRCSRPLCSSQHTGGPLPGSGAYAAYPLVRPAGVRRGSSTGKGPTGYWSSETSGVPVHEGELFARAFRTQQRARRRHPLPRSTPRRAIEGWGCTCCAS